MRPDKYDEMVDACAHLPKHIWDEVRHLPIHLAVQTGEDLLQQEKNDQRARENFIEFLWEIAFVIMLFSMGFFALILF
jgi:hypothetical protein